MNIAPSRLKSGKASTSTVSVKSTQIKSNTLKSSNLETDFSDDYEDLDYNTDISSTKDSRLDELNNQENELRKALAQIKSERDKVNKELENYKENNAGASSPYGTSSLQYNRVNEYDSKSVLQSKKNQYSIEIHEYLDKIAEIEKEKQSIIKENKISKYLSNSKNLTDSELEQFEKLAMYAPFLFDPEKMDYKKWNGYQWNYDYNGYDNYADFIDTMKKRGITTEDIDKSLPNGEKIDWSKVESAFSKDITNLDIAFAFQLKGSNARSIFYQGQATSEFLNRIEYMTDDEITEAYNVYTNQGLEKFQEYLDSKNAEINKREGMYKALQFLSTVDLEDPNYQDYIRAHFKGLEDGLEQFGHGMEVFLSPMNSLSKDITADQYEAMFITSILGQSNANVEGIFKDWNALQKVYTLSSAEGNMLPSMVAGTLGSVFGMGELGAFTMFCSVTGTSAENAYQQGYDLYSAWVYGALSGASEAGLEYVLGGIPGISKIADKSFLVKIFSEGVEESLQEILDPYLKYVVTGETPEINWENVLEAGIDGMILAAYLNGGEVVIGSTTIGGETLEFLQNNYQHFKENEVSAKEIQGVLEYIETQNLLDSINSLQAEGVEIDYSRITEAGYIESLQKESSNTSADEHVKIVDMTPEQIHQSIQEEISFLNPNSADYETKVELLKTKEQLELELIEKTSQIKKNSSSPQKSIDLLSIEQQQQVRDAAHSVRSNAELREPVITSTMESLTDSNTHLEGLDFKLKSESSIQDKISRKLYKGLSLEEAQNSIQDSVRYTLIVSENYEATVIEKLKILKSQGYEVVDINNAWGNDIYQGLNVNLKTRDGVYLELQFHTNESFHVKEHLNHELYELSRNTSTSQDVRDISDQIQAINQTVYVGSDTTFNFKSVSELNEALELNSSIGYYNELKQEILDNIPKKLNNFEKAKYIYNELNFRISYNPNYFLGTSAEKAEIYQQQFNIDSLTEDNVVCIGWANMYAKFLNEQGITAKVMGKGNGHKWVAFELGDGSKWIADATQPYNGATDLTNSKLNVDSGGFFQVTDEMYNSDTLLQGEYNYRSAIGQSKSIFDNSKLLARTDSKLGYNLDTISNLIMKTNYEAVKIGNEVLNLSENATTGEIVAAKLEQVIFPQMEKLSTMEGLGYYVLMRNIFSANELKLIEKWTKIPTQNGYDIQIRLNLENGKVIEYVYESNGKVTKDYVDVL